MPVKRATFAGMTDYMGVGLSDMLEHLRDWERDTAAAAVSLQGHLLRAKEVADRLENSREVFAFCEMFSALFGRYASDLHRLVEELPNGVREAHVKIARQLYDSARYEDDAILRFRNEWVYDRVKDESLRPLLESIYTDAREVVIDFQDLSNLASRLETFVGTESPREVFSDFHLKPNFFGIGWNLNRTLARLGKWWKTR